jgi:hypothetical protein
VALLFVASCGGAQRRTGSDMVPLGEWCEVGTATLCRALEERCFSGMSGAAAGCMETSVDACLAGRSPSQSSGRTYTQLGACLDVIAPLSCAQLGFATGSGALAAVCSASPQTGSP